jgi:cytochrome c-type biogenesis protein CcmH
MRRLLICLGLLLAVGPVLAAIGEIYEFDTPAQEERYTQLIDELRCLVCQNQNLAASNAELAQDLRRKTYDMVMAGKSNEEIVSYMVQRYGDFVLYRPPFKATTAMLWIGPFVILAGGVAVLLTIIRRQSRKTEPALSEEDKQRAERLLEAEDIESKS